MCKYGNIFCALLFAILFLIFDWFQASMTICQSIQCSIYTGKQIPSQKLWDTYLKIMHFVTFHHFMRRICLFWLVRQRCLFWLSDILWNWGAFFNFLKFREMEVFIFFNFPNQHIWLQKIENWFYKMKMATEIKHVFSNQLRLT